MLRLTLVLVLVAVLADDLALAQNCLCPLLYSPVCGSNGRQYDNSCLAGCNNVRVACQGPCSSCRGGGGNRGNNFGFGGAERVPLILDNPRLGGNNNFGRRRRFRNQRRRFRNFY